MDDIPEIENKAGNIVLHSLNFLFMRSYPVYVILFVLLLLVGRGFAQRATIYGYVYDAASGERLAGASVSIPERSVGTTSNAYGFYSISTDIQPDSVSLLVTFVGYTAVLQKVSLSTSLEIIFRLEAGKLMEEVVIAAKSGSRIQQRTQMSAIGLSSAAIKALPAFLGETDVLKAIQLLPGIQAGAEGSSGLYVRGGSPDQNLILLDGVPVYNATHLFGFFSVFNADAINGVDVIKGGFPARYGGRLSSVIDIRMKEGNNQSYHGEGSIGVIASKLTLEGPIQKGRSSFMISGRRTYADIFMRPIIRRQSDGESDAGYYYYDLNTKLNFKISEKDHLYLSGYFGNDKFSARNDNRYENGEDKSETGIKWGNATAVARWNHRFSKKLFSNFTANFTQYQFGLFNNSTNKNYNPVREEKFNERYFSGIRDWSVKADLDWLPSPAHFIKMGIAHTWHRYSPGALQSNSLNLPVSFTKSEINNREMDVYIEDDIKISPNLKSNIGLHYTLFSVPEKNFSSLQPRLSLLYLLNDNMSIKASYVQMSQFIHLLTNSTVGLPTDLWLPATLKVPPQRSTQYALGWAYDLNRKYEFSIEGYYKSMFNVMEYAEGSGFLSGIMNWEDRVERGKGDSYGGEFFIQRKTGKTTGMAGYTLSWTNRQFDNLNNGKRFPFKYDRRHDFKIAVVHDLTKRIQISGDWVFSSGAAITLPESSYELDGSQITHYGERNSYRMPAYHRMDVSIKFLKQKKKFERAWVISVYNVYNRLNTFYINMDTEYDSMNGTRRNVLKKITLFPVIPSISYQFKF